MSATSDLYDQLRTAAAGVQIQANTADTYAQTQERIQNVLMRKQQMDIQNQMREAMLKDMTTGAPAADPDASPTSVAAQPSIGYDANNPLVKAVRETEAQMAPIKRLQRAAQQAGSIKDFEDTSRELATLNTSYRQAQKALNDDMGKKAQQTSDVLAGVKDQASQDAALDFIANNIGVGAARKVMQALPTDAIGRPVYDPDKSPAALTPFVNQFKKAHEQAEEKQQADNFKQRADFHKDKLMFDYEQEADRKVRIKQEDQRIAIAKDGRQKSEKELTTSQQRANEEIDNAREEVAALSEEQLAPYFNPMTPQNMLNPRIQTVLTNAGKKKYGDDPTYVTTRKLLNPVKFAERGQVTDRFKKDPAMSGFTLGKFTDDSGYEVRDKDGKLVGHFQ